MKDRSKNDRACTVQWKNKPVVEGVNISVSDHRECEPKTRSVLRRNLASNIL